MADQTHPCDFCGYPNPLSARTCEACGQPVRMPSQDATIMVPRKPVEEPSTLEQTIAALKPDVEESTAQPEPPASPVEPAFEEQPSPPVPEPFDARDVPDYPLVTPSPPTKKSKTGLIIALILIGGLICLLAVAAGGYFIVRNLSNRFQPTLESLVEPQKAVVNTLEAAATFVPIPLEGTGVPQELATSMAELFVSTPAVPEIQLPSGGSIAAENYIHDDFSSEDLDWGFSSDEISIHQREDEAYTILVTQPEYIAWTNVPADFYPTYAEFDAWVPGGGDGGSYGVLCHYQSDTDYYYIEIDISEWSYSIGHYLDGEYLPLLDPNWIETGAVNSGPDVNHVLVTCETDLLALFINNQFVDQVSLPEPALPGEMAIFGSTWDDMPAGGYKVYFDNFSAWKPIE